MNALLLLLAAGLGVAGPARRVAVTFDDLPGAIIRNRCDAEALLRANVRLLDLFRKAGAPVIGFVNEGRLCEELPRRVLDEVLDLWLAAGMDLGNHTYSHPDIDRTSLADFQADVLLGESTTRRLLEARGKTLRYFRHPFLHAGRDIEKKRSLEAFLRQGGYTVAPVTIDNQEWMYAAVYAEARAQEDGEAVERVASAYLEHMEESFAFYEGYSVELFGREIPQVLLVHVNDLNADLFGGVIEMMRGRGYEFIELEQALGDPAYNSPDSYAGPAGLSWLLRWGLTRGRAAEAGPQEPEWLARLYSSSR